VRHKVCSTPRFRTPLFFAAQMFKWVRRPPINKVKTLYSVETGQFALD